MGENSQEMTINKEGGSFSQGNFAELKETPPFKTNGIPGEGSKFAARQWLKYLDETAITKMVGIRRQIFQLLGVKSFPEIQNIIKDEKLREETSKRAYGLLGKMYEISGEDKDIASRIGNYAGRADYTINYLNDKFELSDPPIKFEMINEVSSTSNPTDLLLMIFDERYSTRARFEAKRKLALMSLAASIDQRERETNNEEKFKKFIKFLDTHVLDKDIKIGETESVFVLSNHDPETFGNTSYTILTKKEKEEREKSGIRLEKGRQKLTELSWRKFTKDDRQIPIQYSTRIKSREAKILKLLRKGVENPAVAVEDDLGIMAVFKSAKDIDRFQERLVQGATEYGSYMSFEEVEDTLKHGNHNSKNIGSNPELKQRNFYIKTDGVRFDAITHTIDTYLDYLYKDGVSHVEYEVKRLFDTGVVGMLFPSSIYNDVNWTEIKPKIIQTIRQRNRN